MNWTGVHEQTIDVHLDRGPKRRQGTRKLGELIKDMHTAMLITATPGKHLRSRPMSTLQSELEDELWFYADARSGLIDDITENHQVSLSYMDPGRHRYVSVSGVAHVVDDAATIQRYWNARAAEWFPNGPDGDPNLVLIRVQLEEAQYWDVPSRSMVRLFGFDADNEPAVRLAS